MSYQLNQISFIIELLAGVLLFTTKFKRRERVRWLFVPIVIFLYGMPFASMPHGEASVTGILKNTVYYGISVLTVVAVVFFCFRASWLDAFIVSVSAYTAQHCAYNVLMSVLIILGYDINEIYFTPAFLLLQLLLYGIVYMAVYLIFGRNFEIDQQKVQNGLAWIVSCLAILFLVIVFNLAFVNRQPEQVRLICYVYDTTCTVLGMMVLILISKNDQLWNDLRQMEQVWKLKREYYELSKENIDLINIKCHDIRRHIAELGKCSLDHETLREIEGSITIYDSTFQTGNDSLDVILTEKSLFCDKNDIKLTCMADGRRLNFLARTDLFCLLGNIIDNAIEAVQKLDDPSRRVISLTIKANGQFLSIQEENYCAGELKFENGLPVTTKEDAQYHGFGMKSISYLTKKYGGEMSVKVKQGVFFLTLLVPIPCTDPATA